MAIWVLLSGKFDTFHITLGIISSAIIAFFFSDLLFRNLILGRLPRVWFRFIVYIPWLIYQIFLANIHVLYLVFHPRMLELIDPKIIEFRSKLKKEMSILTFANSITLTPGTITVSATVLGKFAVHAIDETSGRALPGEMEKRVERIFED
ncbi:MAG: Na+/H+ antiporter subunit E [Desulfobacterales bacterium]|nr:Na+/H+ antiporter subunit E [Desulfobacterales bacterium]